MKVSKEALSQDTLKYYLDYNPNTGWFTWKTKEHSKKVVVGARAGSVSTLHRHRVLKLLGTLYAEHRLVWLYCKGSWPKGHIDHINHNEQDNRLVNLRDVPQQVNNMNSSKRTDNSSGYPGVWINKLNAKKKFMAELTLAGKRVHYSSHYTIEEAITARKQAKRDNGFHPNHGIVKPTESSTTIQNTP